jgi:hypothetical protein
MDTDCVLYLVTVGTIVNCEKVYVGQREVLVPQRFSQMERMDFIRKSCTGVYGKLNTPFYEIKQPFGIRR